MKKPETGHSFFSDAAFRKSKLSANFLTDSSALSKAAHASKTKMKSILKIAEKKPPQDTPRKQNTGKRVPKKVHFVLPKASNAKRSLRSLDPNMAFVRQWLNIMILPLSYEMWAFPYRLALGVPSTSSALCYADASCDGLFFLDMIVSLATALPATPGKDEVTSFQGIAAHYFSRTFPSQILPCCAYWIITPICARSIDGLCAGASAGSFECVIGSVSWGVWLWWGAALLRLVPRFLRLRAHFKAMESNLVTFAASIARHRWSLNQCASQCDLYQPTLLIARVFPLSEPSDLHITHFTHMLTRAFARAHACSPTAYAFARKSPPAHGRGAACAGARIPSGAGRRTARPARRRRASSPRVRAPVTQTKRGGW